jgi:hypothetical protein
MTTTFPRTARRTSTWSAPGKWSRAAAAEAAAAEAAAIAATAPTTSPAPATFNNAVATAGGDTSTSLGGKRQLKLRPNCRDLTLQQRNTSTQLIDSRFLLRDTALQ